MPLLQGQVVRNGLFARMHDAGDPAAVTSGATRGVRLDDATTPQPPAVSGQISFDGH